MDDNYCVVVLRGDSEDEIIAAMPGSQVFPESNPSRISTFAAAAMESLG